VIPSRYLENSNLNNYTKKKHFMRQKPIVQILVLAFFVIPNFVVKNSSFFGNVAGADLPPPPQAPNRPIYLPVIFRPGPNHVITGLYTPMFYNEQGVQQSLVQADQFAGKKHSLGALFWSMEDPPDYNLLVQLNTLWSYGYTPFINLSSNESCNYNDPNDRSVMQKFADGRKDSAIHQTAKAYKSFISGDSNRKAFIALFPEMNGDWTCYYAAPAVFQSAYDRIRRIFTEEGVDLGKTWWVFAPNGYTEPGSEFEKYYPGDNKVDIVAFSSYNFGYCPIVRKDWRSWTEPTTVFGSYLNRMRSMAPTKPIIIAQTGTTAYYANGLDHTKKNQWLIDAYNLLANTKGVIGVLYFDITRQGECDYPVFNKALSNYNGYKQGIANYQYEYIKPEDLSQMELVVTP
jgi:hypothetical protein